MNRHQLRIERGRALRIARERAQLTAQALVDAARNRSNGSFHLSTAAIYSYEKGRILLTPEVAQALAPILRVQVEELLIDDETAAEIAGNRAVLLGGTPTKSAEPKTSAALCVRLEIRWQGGDSERPLREREWWIRFDPERGRFQIEARQGASPQQVTFTQDEVTLSQRPDRIDATKAFAGPISSERLVGTEGLPLDEDDVALTLDLAEPLLAGEIRQLMSLARAAESPAASPDELARTSARAKDAVLGKDAVLELSDFLPSPIAVKLVSLWEQGGGSLEQFLEHPSVRLIKDDYQRTLIQVLARLSLLKSHEGIGALVQELPGLAGADQRRIADAYYLLGRQQWYVKKDLIGAIVSFQRALATAEETGNFVRAAQCLIYLARIGTDYPDKFTEPAERLIDRAVQIAANEHRTDIELLARRAKINLLQREGRIDEAIHLADQIISASEQYRTLGGDVGYILDSIRVNLAISLRRRQTEEARREAERLLQLGVARNRDDSHAGMCLYLQSDLWMDRALADWKSAIEAASQSQRDEELRRCAQAESHIRRALELCERSMTILDRPGGDIAARHKAQRRLLMLRNQSLELPQDTQAAVDEFAVREQRISRMLLGSPAVGERYDPTRFDVSRDFLDQLLNEIFATRHMRTTGEVDTATITSMQFLRPGGRLGVAWPIGDSLVVRVFEDRPSRGDIESCGWFMIESWTTHVQGRLRHILRSGGDEAWEESCETAFDCVTRATRTIQPLKGDRCDATIMIAPHAAEDWFVPLEWLTTEQITSDEPSPPLLEMPRDGMLFATTAIDVFQALDTRVDRQDVKVYVDPNVHELSRRQLGGLPMLAARLLKDADPLPEEPGFRPESRGVMILGHADDAQTLLRRLKEWRFDRTEVVVLLFCASAQSQVVRGPFADGLALTIRNQIPRHGLVIASRLSVRLDEALAFGAEFLNSCRADVPVARLVTGYLQRQLSRNPYEVPWVIL